MKKLNKDELEEINIILERWLIPLKNVKNCENEEIQNTKKLYNSLHDYFKDVDFNPFIKAFSERLGKISSNFTKSEQVSGSVCFFGGIAISLLNYGHIEEIEGLFTFALCYMIVDNFLDNNTVKDYEKEDFIKNISSFILEGKNINNNQVLSIASKRYLELIERVPKCKEYIIKLFESEIKGVKIQKNKDFERNIYLEIAKEKGGLTSACIGIIIGLNNEEIIKLGENIQFVDDLLDIQDDIKLNIFTLARFDLENKNLDEYLYETIKSINNLNSVYNVFKIILLFGIILAIHDNPNHISKELDDIIQKYNLFDKETTKYNLIDWFNEKLFEYIKN